MTSLRRGDLERFFGALESRLPFPITIVLTGGAEALLLGGTRPTGDVDFEVRVAPRWRGRWPEVDSGIAEASRSSGVAVQYSDDVDRWSSISVPERRRRSRPWLRLGRLRVRLLDPACWAIYKIARYLESDRADLVHVLRREKVVAARLARLAGESLRASPRSSALFLFRRHFEHFVREEGGRIWGRRFDPESTLRVFSRAAGLEPRNRDRSI